MNQNQKKQSFSAKLKSSFHSTSNFNKFIYTISISYVIGVSLFMLWHRSWFSPDQFFVFAIVGSLFVGRMKAFLFDWIPFLILFFSYEYLRGLVPFLHGSVNIFPMISADMFLFGFIPSVKFQQLLFQPTNLHWYDYLSVTIYISHFIAPMIFGYVLWITNKKVFKEFTAALLLVSYAAFVTYIIYPAMPPWMASNNGYIPPLNKIMDAVIGNFGTPISMPTIYQFIRSNEVAAMPSLHASYPFLIFLMALRAWKKKALVLIPYVLAAWFAIIYLGEHYVIDLIVGVAYTFVTFTLITNWKKILRRLQSPLSYKVVPAETT